MSGVTNLPDPINEPVLGYAPGSRERAEVKAALDRVRNETVEIPAIVGGEELRSGDLLDVVSPHDHRRVLARAHQATPETIDRAVASAVDAQRAWAELPFADRAAVFLRAADLLAGPWRALINAATMAGQSKTVHQAEIDAACELIDFLRFNVHFAERLQQEQPASSAGMWNRLDHRPLEGFVYAISPFNFTAIGGNLSSAPAMLGNVAVWKPAATALLSNYYVYRLFEAAGLPPGVINFLPGNPVAISDRLLADRHLAGIHFTGSTTVFQSLWRTVAANLPEYRGYPRLVGETGGKDFVVAHASANAAEVATGLLRGAFEYQGQKCSAASRAYIPSNLWPEVRDRLVAMIGELQMGDVADFRNFMGAVIDRKSFDKLAGHLDRARGDSEVRILAGGGADASDGFFVEPTLVESSVPGHTLMCEELFGPVLTVYVYPEAQWEETLALVDATSPYALTGAVFARDRDAVATASRVLRNAAGNFYVNDKPTGAVVGQQPFGGGRASGTNDKAGSILNLQRWVSPRTIKETFVPPTDWRYPFLDGE